METQKSRLLKVTRKWWFYVVLILAQVFIWPYSTANFSYLEIGDMIGYTLGNSLQVKMHGMYIYFQLFAILILFLLFYYKNRFAKVFNWYVMLSYIAFAVLQNVAITDKYGLSIVTINVCMFLFVGMAWLGEILKPQNDYSFTRLNWGHSWLIALSVLAFWIPLNHGAFDFNPKYFLFNGSSLAFCMMTPVFLTILTINSPNINIAAYRITAIIGVIIGLYNMNNFQNPATVNLAILHLPLLIISLYAMYNSFKIENHGKKI